MKYIQNFMILITLYISGCKSDNNADIIINNITAKEYLLTDLATDIQILTLRSPEPIDEASSFKVYGDHVLIIDKDKTKLYDFYKGNLQTVLDKIGRGPGEYFNINSYSYDPLSDFVYIYDRSDQELICYDLKDDCKYIRSINTKPYGWITKLSLLNSNKMVMTCEIACGDQFGCIRILDLNTLSADSLCSLNYFTTVMNSITMSDISIDNYAFGLCNSTSYLCKMVPEKDSFKIDTICSILSGNGKDIDSAMTFVDNRDVEQYQKWVDYQDLFYTMPVSPVITDNGFSFNYITNKMIGSVPPNKQESGVYIHRNNGEDIMASGLKIPGLSRNGITMFTYGDRRQLFLQYNYENIVTLLDLETISDYARNNRTDVEGLFSDLGTEVVDSVMSDSTVAAVILSYKLE